MIAAVATALQHIPAATILVDDQGMIVNLNQPAEQLFGYQTGCLHNQPLAILVPWDRRELHTKLVGEYVANPAVRPQGTGLPLHGIKKDGSLFPVEILLKPIVADHKVAVVATVHDLSGSKQTEQELRQTNRALRFLASVNRTLLRCDTEYALLHEICRLAAEVGGYRMAWVGLAEQDEEKNIEPAAYYGFDNGFLERIHISWGDNERGQTPLGIAIRSNTPTIRNNILADPQLTHCRADAKQRGYQSVIALPLTDEARVFAALAIYASEPNAFREQEKRLLSELAEDISYCLRKIRRTETAVTC